MSNYGKNFEFRVPPAGRQRAARFVTPSTPALPIGAPIGIDVSEAVNTLGLQPIELHTAAIAPVSGIHGILVYEYKLDEAFAGEDPFLTTYSDLNLAPVSAAVQMVSGPDIKVVLRNVAAETFLANRSYSAFTIVAGLGATPTLAVGNYLTPGPGDSSSGYWQETADASLAWLVITKVDTARSEVEARFVF